MSVDAEQIDFTGTVAVSSEITTLPVTISAFNQVVRARRFRVSTGNPIRVLADARLRVTK